MRAAVPLGENLVAANVHRASLPCSGHAFLVVNHKPHVLEVRLQPAEGLGADVLHLVKPTHRQPVPAVLGASPCFPRGGPRRCEDDCES